MAKAKKNQKRTAKNTCGIFLLNIDLQSEKGLKIRGICEGLAVPVRSINLERLGDPVGAIAGLAGFKPSAKPYAGSPLESEFMLVSNLSNQQLDSLLAQMREAKASIDLKATVTTFNKMWPLGLLVQEVAKEHAQMNPAAR